MGKPRMTRADAWKKRSCVLRYWAYKDELNKWAKTLHFTMPESHYHLVFYLPMPPSWSAKKRADMLGKPHQGKPDKDNLEKGFLDSLCAEDSGIWDGRVSKYWSKVGEITIRTGVVWEF